MKPEIKRIFTTISLAILLIISSFAVLGIASGANAVELPVLWLNPAQANVPFGGSTVIVIQLDDISNVYGAQVSLSYDPSVLSVVDADPGKAGVQINPGNCPQPDFVVVNIADNDTGTIEYAVTQLSPASPCNGGDVARLTLRCVIPDVVSQVSFTESIIADPNSLPIEHAVNEGIVTCLPGNQIFLPIVVMSK